MIIVLIGAPGAGKGTQADLLVEQMGWRKLSTGDALRKHIRLGSEVGKLAVSYMNEGQLVPDDVLFQVLREELGSNSQEVILLDGYPRNLHQAKVLEGIAELHPVKAVIHLDVSSQDLIERLSGRRTCSQCGASYHVKFNAPRQEGFCDKCGSSLVSRPDDQAEKIAVRLDVYDKETSPVLDFYKQQGLYRHLAACGATQEVFAQLKSMLSEVLS